MSHPNSISQPQTEKANGVADAINSVESGRALAVVGDITDVNYITELVKRAAEFGGGKIHIIVNNAGFTWDGVIHKVCRRFSPSMSNVNWITLPIMLRSTFVLETY